MPAGKKRKRGPKGSMCSLRANMCALIREEEFEGRLHYVVPVVLMAEGVHNGIYYSAEELSKFPDAWNGQPIPVYHPKEGESPVSANSPKVIDDLVAGRIFNCKFENGKLKGEAWIDPEKADKIDPQIMVKLNNGEMIEVSIGVWEEDEVVDGEWHGQPYDMIAHNLRPDHLALLPDGQGACSVSDGGGMPRINEQKQFSVLNAFKAMAKHLGFQVQQISHDGVRDKLRDTLNSPDGMIDIDSYCFVMDVYDDYLIYEKNEHLYKQAYTKMDDEVELAGDAIEVKRVVSFVPVISQTNDEKKQGDDNMPRKEAIDALIANSDWTEDDIELLTGMTDDQFARIDDEQEDPDATPGVTPKVEIEPTTPAVELEVDGEDEEITTDSYLQSAPPEIREVMTSVLQMQKQAHAETMAGILALPNCPFTEAELTVKSLDELDKFAQLAQAPVPKFVAQGGSGEPQMQTHAGGVEIADPPPVMNWDKK